MRKFKDKTQKLSIVLLVFILLFIPSCSSDSSQSSSGNELLEEAEKMEQAAYYQTARDMYKTARQAFVEEGNNEKASYCRQKYFDMQLICLTYPVPQDYLPEMMKNYNENWTQQDLEKWMSEGLLDNMTINGAPWYFSDCFPNLSYRNPDIFASDPKLQSKINMFAGLISDYLNTHPVTGENLSNPLRFEATQKLEIPRDVLPAKGTLRLWIPAPIETASQRDIEMVTITPVQYHKQGPDINTDIGCVYFEVSLADLEDDLNIEVKFRFTRYDERFNIDPEKVGEYDTESELYKKYTAASDNVALTDEIKQKAAEIVGNETNPYLKTKLISDYIIKNIKYSTTPHVAQQVLRNPISSFVQQMGYGDCGCQAIYFSALCRAVGIPARPTGGYELWVPNGSGHFWAEFYLPDYGWVPYDPSLIVVTSLSMETSEEDKEKISEYLFGNMDPYRLTFQNGTDLDLIPSANEPLLTSISFQMVMAECPEMEENPTIVVSDYYKWEINEID